MDVWTIYQHKFPNGKSYIGKTSQLPEYRWGANGQGYGDRQPLMKNAIHKYGWDNIERVILEDGLTAEEANIKEQEYIEKFHTYYLDTQGPGYNMTRGGEGGLKNDPNEVERLYKEGNSTYKIADKLHTDTSRVSQILRKKGYDLSKNNCKMINQFTLDGEYIATYESAQEAERQTKIDRKLISGVVRGIAKSSGGFQWRYYNEDDLSGISSVSRKKGGAKEKKVGQYDMNDNLIRVFNSISEAAKAVDRERSNIRAAAQGKCKSSAGYKWKYIDEDNVN